MKSIFFSLLLFLMSCNVAKKTINTTSSQTSFKGILKNNNFTKAKMDNLIKNDDKNAHSLCDYVENNNIAEASYNPSCALVPLKTFKFNWSKSVNQPVNDFSDYLVPDSNFIFYYTKFKDSIIGFSYAYRELSSNKFKMQSGSQNDGNPESRGTIQNTIFKECKFKSTEVFIIRYTELRIAFAFFSNNELNVVTYYGPDIVRHKNFNEWANSRSKIVYQ